MLNKIAENLMKGAFKVSVKEKENEIGAIVDYPGVKLVAVVGNNGFAPDFTYLFLSGDVTTFLSKKVKEMLATEPQKTTNGKAIWKDDNVAIVPVNDNRLYIEVNVGFVKAKIFVDKAHIDDVIIPGKVLGFKRHTGDLLFDCSFERKQVKMGNVVWDKTEKKYKTVYEEEGKYVTMPLSGTADGMYKASVALHALESALEKAKEIANKPRIDESMYEYAE